MSVKFKTFLVKNRLDRRQTLMNFSKLNIPWFQGLLALDKDSLKHARDQTEYMLKGATDDHVHDTMFNRQPRNRISSVRKV